MQFNKHFKNIHCMINHHVDVPCQGRECRDVILLLKKKDDEKSQEFV